MIDTVVLAGLTDPHLRNVPPPGPASHSRAEDEWQWIEQTLSSSTADWIIVAGHYPGVCTPHFSLSLICISLCTDTVWSIAEHGPTKELVDRLRPMLQKYNVSS